MLDTHRPDRNVVGIPKGCTAHPPDRKMIIMSHRFILLSTVMLMCTPLHAGDVPAAETVAADVIGVVRVESISLHRQVSLPDGEAARAWMNENMSITLKLIPAADQDILATEGVVCSEARTDLGQDLRQHEPAERNDSRSRHMAWHRMRPSGSRDLWPLSLPLKGAAAGATKLSLAGHVNAVRETAVGRETTIALDLPPNSRIDVGEGRSVTLLSVDGESVRVRYADRLEREIKDLAFLDAQGKELSQRGSSSSGDGKVYTVSYGIDQRAKRMRIRLLGPTETIKVLFSFSDLPLTAPLTRPGDKGVHRRPRAAKPDQPPAVPPPAKAADDF